MNNKKTMPKHADDVGFIGSSALDTCFSFGAKEKPQHGHVAHNNSAISWGCKSILMTSRLVCQ